MKRSAARAPMLAMKQPTARACHKKPRRTVQLLTHTASTPTADTRHSVQLVVNALLPETMGLTRTGPNVSRKSCISGGAHELCHTALPVLCDRIVLGLH